MNEFVLLKACFHKHDADLTVGLLKNNGIEAFVQSDDAGGFRQHLTLSMGNNRVMVPKQELAKALDVMKLLEEEASDEEIKEMESLALHSPEPISSRE